MRQHKAVARTILFLSIVNFTFAGVAQTPTMDEMRVNLVTGAADVTEASERGHTRPEESPERLRRLSTTRNLHSRLDPIVVADAAAEEKKFFSKEMNRKLKEYLVLGSVAGLILGVTNSIQKEIMGTLSPGAQTIGRSVEPLNEHSQDQEDLVSHSLSNMGDEDLKMLSILSRRMFNSLD